MEYIQDNPIPSASPPWGGQPYCNPFSKWENSSVCTWGIKIQLSRCEVHMHSMIPTRTPSYCPCRLLSVSRLHNLRKVKRGLHNKVSSEKRAEIGKYATEYKVISATADILHISGIPIETRWLALYLHTSAWSAWCTWQVCQQEWIKISRVKTCLLWKFNLQKFSVM